MLPINIDKKVCQLRKVIPVSSKYARLFVLFLFLICLLLKYNRIFGALLVHFLKWFRVSEADISKVTSDIYDTEIYGPTWVSFLYFINELGAWRKPRFLEEAQVLIAEVHLRHDHTIHAHPWTTQRPPAFRWFKIWSSPVSCLTSPISYLYLHCFVPRLTRSFCFFNISTVLLPAWSGPFFFSYYPCIFQH